MLQEIIPLRISLVNSYLIKNDDEYILIDTGFSMQRRAIKKELEQAGCRRGNLRLIVITHGDSDHTGNAVYIRQVYGARIGTHRKEADTCLKGDMRLNRQRLQSNPNFLTGAVLALPFARLGRANRFKPDIYLEDGQDLSGFGCNAKIVHIPGHTSGSVGVITADGDLFCGDLLKNNGKPAKNSLVDDPAEMDASIVRLGEMGVRMVCPGHGRPFTMEEFFREA